MIESSWKGEVKRHYLLSLIRDVAVKVPENPVEVPEELQGFGTVVRDMSKCVSCGACSRVCEEDAMVFAKEFDISRVLGLPEDSKAKNMVEIGKLIRSLMKKEPEKNVPVPQVLKGFGTPTYNIENCVACKKCVEICDFDVLSLELTWNLPEIFEKFE
ncbi:MAG: 4Fe-4S dicluster domain-containing protein [Promethearchaeota archaeon]